MSTQPMDYAAILADLEAKKAVIDSAIASVRAAMAAGALGVGEGAGAATTPATTPFNGDIPRGLFFGKSIPEAAKLYLSMVKQKQSTADIVRALEEGGMETTSDDFSATVNAGLFRASRKFGEIVRVKGQWGLAGWYKGMRVGPPEKKVPAKKRVRRTVKAKVSQPKQKPVRKGVAEGQSEPTTAKKKGDQALIEAHFSDHPGEEFAAGDLAGALNIRVQTVALICSKLAHQGRLEKTQAGKFRIAKVHAMPKAV